MMATKVFAALMLFICLSNYEVFACPGNQAPHSCSVSPCQVTTETCDGYDCRDDFCEGCNIKWYKDFGNGTIIESSTCPEP